MSVHFVDILFTICIYLLLLSTGICPLTKNTGNYKYIGTITVIDIIIFNQREKNIYKYK